MVRLIRQRHVMLVKSQNTIVGESIATIVGEHLHHTNNTSTSRDALTMAEHGGHNAEHAEHGLPLLDDNPSNTPLDLLLNAISGSGGYAFPEPEAEGEGGDDVNAAPADGDAAISALLGEAEEHDEHDAGKYDGAESPRQAKVARTLRNHFAGIRGDAFSTIEVWHPKTGQKSYGKERR